MTVRVYIGYGLGGAIWGSGLDTLLARPIRSEFTSRVIVPPTIQYTQWAGVLADMEAHSDPAIFIGDSLSANNETWAAAQLGSVTQAGRVLLLVSYDATVTYTRWPLTNVVKWGIGFRSTNWWNPLGHAPLTAGPAFKGIIQNYREGDVHGTEAADVQLARITMTAVRKVMED